MNNKYHSRFGGLWIDQINFDNEIDQRIKSGAINTKEAAQIVNFVNDGYVILEGACSGDEIDQFKDEISRAFISGHDKLRFQYPGDRIQRSITPGMSTKNIRVVDSYVYLESARKLLANSQLEKFFKNIFNCDPLLFQSLSFDMGSEQGFHQDTAYVVVDKPLELAACWIALEDIREGSGELSYIEGSHRLPDFNFGGNKKHWNPETDGHQVHNEWGEWIAERSKELGLVRKTFLAKKGDVLIWHADLVHGGSKIIDENLTRRSLVGHFCPVHASPNYFSYLPSHRIKKVFSNTYFSSEHYEIEK